MAQPESAPPSRPPPSGASRDLSAAEFAELADLLDAIPEPLTPLAIDTADGFLAALAVQPVPIESAQWLRFVFDADGHRWGEAEPSPEQLRAGALLQRRLAAIEGELAEFGNYAPYLLEAPVEAPPGDDARRGEPDTRPADDAARPEPAVGTVVDPIGAPIAAVIAPWLSGFFLAADRWPLSADAEDAIVERALARLERYLVEPLAEPPASVDAAVDDAVRSIMALRERAEAVRFHVETVRRDAAKVGRNDPCPCGSGRKFKQCHGRRA